MKCDSLTRNILGTIGVGAGKFLGVRRIFVRISPNLPEKLLCHFLCKHFLKQTFFWDELYKRSSFCKRLAPFFQIKPRWAPFLPRCSGFCEVFHSFAQISTDFARILKDFARIFTKSKLLEVCLHPRLLHHCSRQ